MCDAHSIGESLPRIDAREKVRGEAVFAADVQLPQILAGTFLPNPHAHAEILSIDASRAEAQLVSGYKASKDMKAFLQIFYRENL
jgi:xanthine dehydrogenase molybdenum-binding subunit